MALQVWLPLNGNLKNQGTAKVTVTNSGATVNDNGKIGKCYYFNGSSYIRISMPSDMTTILNSTVCAWVKSTSSTLALGGISNDTSYANAMCTLYTSGWQFAGASTYKYLSGGSVANTSVWHHVACTINNTTITTYLDGVKVTSNTLSGLGVDKTNITSTNFIEIGCDHPGGDEYLTGYVNDFRIYDHCLSPEEVSEVAKGLVLHYKLDDIYIESLTNLTNALSSSCYNGAISKYNYGTTTDMYKTSGVFQGKQCEKVYMGTNGQAAYPYVFFDNLHPSNNSYKTLSFDYYPTIQNQIIFYTYGGSGTTYYRVNNGPQTSGSSIPVNLNSWNHIEFTILGTSDSSSGWGYMRIGTGNHTSNTSNYWLFANIQIEVRDHATGYNSNFHKSIITDSSGYNNNGTINDTNMTISPSSSRYNVTCQTSQANNSSIYPIKGNCALNDIEQLTIAFWAKPTAIGVQDSGLFSTTLNSRPTDYQATAMHHYDSKIALCNTSGVVANIPCGNMFLIGTWHHYACIYNGTRAILYRDAVEVASVNQTGKLKPFSSVFPFYAEAGGAKRCTSGQLSDFRIYCTALTAQQVLDLYKNEASIDNKENIYARELVEE